MVRRLRVEESPSMLPPFREMSAGRFRSRRPRCRAWVLSALLLACLSAGSASAQPPLGADEMLANGVNNLNHLLAQLLPGAQDAVSTLQGISQLADTRRVAHRAVALEFPLDDLTGIILSDRYDEAYVAAVDSLAQRFLLTDPPPPTPEALEAFRARMGQVPPVSETPAAYVVASLLGRIVGAGRLPGGSSEAARAEAALAAVRVIRALTRTYLATRTGDGLPKAQDAWYRSVADRVRCPRHRCGYEVREERAGLRADGSLYRRIVVTCRTGGEERNLDFDLGAGGTLSQTGGRQNLKKPVGGPASRRPGLEP